ncbi:DUF2911 domain-containing protein [Zunongwangia atlantica]|uniref:DUF2911 domain-containing protein n=1 Tax=Zunongwangia atlantica 22II14-10F7 TaxID=1185767 RepID=A0A1Y1T8M3_9FLAO|nr:DUF2911 domain-containing protein [Zunongwangia atlantica]ORL47399.1 hypothetical protein IIF7_01520 [Zunongwangia atlantica 22II14-10F7]
MNNSLKLLLKILGISLLVIAVIFFVVRYNTKAYSPEDTVSYTNNDLTLEVFYNRPYKKGREIFGNLVAYDSVWRTGANEATTFKTNKDIMVDGSLLAKGEYTLWTVPKKESWEIIFNNKMYPWGIDLDGKVYRDPEFDALIVEVPSNNLQETVEQFTIYFEQANDFVFMALAWDRTSVAVPIKIKETPTIEASSNN